MKNHLLDAKWIWCNQDPKDDEYGEFIDCFTYQSGKVYLQISADSNYAAYINGELAAWGQYSDFPYDKVYDEIDVTDYCKKGLNHVAILVWYYGIDTIAVYYPGNAGLLYSLSCEGRVLCKSCENTLSRKSNTYMNHRMQIISSELGYSYGYDITKEDNWKKPFSSAATRSTFSPATIVEQDLPLRIRPCDKLILLPEVNAAVCKQISENDVVFDLGSEQVGFLSFQLFSPCEQDITISYGEHLVDGSVRRIIGPRDFSAFFKLKKGENIFFNPFRRFACRYLEIHSKHPIQVQKLAIAPTMYLVNEKQRPTLTQKQNTIYDMCVETLRLCMHEHYEDCPWREQALYTMDSRNQMLCGYFAFGEYTFPRANLQLISKDNRLDDLLSICYPMKLDFVIPSFSLHYITACKEYMEYSGDIAFINEIYPKLVSIANAFSRRLTSGLVEPFLAENYWNFYEWREGLDGEGTATTDLLINCLFSLALQNLADISNELKIENNYCKQAEILNANIRQTFWDTEKNIFYNYPEHSSYSQLGNALAILCRAITGNDAVTLCKNILYDKDMTPISLSMQCFKYDALLMIDKSRFAPIILEDIEKIYTPMIEFGSTTVWETELGESDFENAGSLCHGWSALPIYYYHILLQK